mmetsp:Transcript_45674/g.126751  ORF Transcript_45674/g.126751 Transcript_45674/m.126751 type:complete len:251 (-) Transcript_45674:1542-2294(-)
MEASDEPPTGDELSLASASPTNAFEGLAAMTTSSASRGRAGAAGKMPGTGRGSEVGAAGATDAVGAAGAAGAVGATGATDADDAASACGPGGGFAVATEKAKAPALIGGGAGGTMPSPDTSTVAPMLPDGPEGNAGGTLVHLWPPPEEDGPMRLAPPPECAPQGSPPLVGGGPGEGSFELAPPDEILGAGNCAVTSVEPALTVATPMLDAIPLAAPVAPMGDGAGDDGAAAGAAVGNGANVVGLGAASAT